VRHLLEESHKAMGIKVTDNSEGSQEFSVAALAGLQDHEGMSAERKRLESEAQRVR
jgi:hypothetical protein